MVDEYLCPCFCLSELLETLFFICFCVGQVFTGLAIFLAVSQSITQKKKKVPVKKPERASAKNGVAVLNAGSVDFQKIKTAEIEIPVIAADVLVYEGGELGEAYPERTRLYYSPEALSDPEYLQTVLHSPISMDPVSDAGHGKNTNEGNVDVNGWASSVQWNEMQKRVIAKGIVIGEENVKYAKENMNLPGFGTSAYIAFLEIDRTPGTSPEGKPYDAVVRKAVNNHIAILPNVRDPKNIILAMNAVQVENAWPRESLERELNSTGDSASAMLRKGRWEDGSAFTSEESRLLKEIAKLDKASNAKEGETTTDKKGSTTTKPQDLKKLSYAEQLKALGLNAEQHDELTALKNTEGKKPMDKEEFKNAMNEYEADKAKEEETVNKIKNAVLEDIKGEGGKNADESDEDKKAKEAANAAEEEKKKEESEAANALPSESMVKDFSDALGITYTKTPTLEQLARDSGVVAANRAELISALNAKRETFKKTETVSAKNEGSDTAKTVNDYFNSL